MRGSRNVTASKLFAAALPLLAGVAAALASPIATAFVPVSQQARLNADLDSANYRPGLAGQSVAIAGDVAVVGAPDSRPAKTIIGPAPAPPAPPGAAYVFERIDGTWTQVQTLLPSDPENGARFGQSVAILKRPGSAEAYYIAVGAPQKTVGNRTRQGVAYVFYRPDAQTAWRQQVRLVNTTDGRRDDFFGTAVDLAAFSSDPLGLTLPDIYAAVSAPTIGFQSQRPGRVHIYSRPFANPRPDRQAQWLQRTILSGTAGTFGQSLSMATRSVLIGNPLLQRILPSGTQAFTGGAYIYAGSGGNWNVTTELLPNDRGAGDAFGGAVALSAGTALVGAPGDVIGPGIIGRGSAYVFVQSGRLWSQQRKLVDANGADDDRFGTSVALAGNLALVGALGDDRDSDGLTDSGSVSLFQRSGAVWGPQLKLNATDGNEADLFGSDVALSDEVILAGAQNADPAPSSIGGPVGAAYVLRIAADWGDAPAGFPTTRNKGGALHLLSSTLKLGAAADAEDDGKASVNALGDDANNPDDEDGATFSVLRLGVAATLRVTVSGSNGRLNAWIDFNRDGDWLDAGEQIARDRLAAVGTTTVNFTVPAGAETGAAYARLRLNRTGGLAPGGLADNGEVEDYRVQLMP